MGHVNFFEVLLKIAPLHYYNRHLKKRYTCEELDQLVVCRVRQYLEEDGLLGQVYEKSLGRSQLVAPFWEEERAQLKRKVAELERVTAGFSQSLRDLALAGTSGEKMAEAVQFLLNERKQVEAELLSSKERLEVLETQQARFQRNLEGTTLKLFLQKIMSRFEKLPALEKKRVIHAVVIKVVITENNEAELHIDLDPNRPAKREFLKIKVPIQAPGAAHSVEYKSSGFDVNGGGYAKVVVYRKERQEKTSPLPIKAPHLLAFRSPTR